MNDRPLTRPYARIERERRFLLDQMPDHVDAHDYRRIIDLYIADSRLRLRRIEQPDGQLVLMKLGQKTRDPAAPADLRRRQMTTLYLQPGEERWLVQLPGRRSVKRRYQLPEQGWTFCIDVYEQPESAAGIMLCEVECDTDSQLETITTPIWAVREITQDPRYSGAALAEPGAAASRGRIPD